MRRAVIAIIVFLALPALSSRLQPNQYKGGRSRDQQERFERNSSAVAQMLGEFRISMGDILFLKTERYLHNGMAFKAHLNQKQLLNVYDHDHNGHGAGDEHHDEHDHENLQTIIPTRAHDFRGFIGELERQVKPWQDPSEHHHEHTDGSELLPWYRVMTLADPHNVRAYIIGGYWLKNHSIDEGIRFISEGIRENPDVFELRLSLGRLYMNKAQSLMPPNSPFGALPEPNSEAERCFLKAQEAFEIAAEMGLKVRPAGWSQEAENPSEDWSIFREEDLLEAMGKAIQTGRIYRSKEHALELAERYYPLLPDPLMLRYLNQMRQLNGLDALPETP
ncbi:hypothetical protein JXA32_14855 [Candidatus Sumerlaeota bacterium]|nr:hypothetical protein [Candidatus Sumerlaeota bacterium]